jgi:hypothetical protein
MPVLYLVWIMPSYSRKTINRMHTKINILFDCGGNRRQRSAGVRRHERNSLDPRKDDFLKLMMQSSCSFMRDARLDCL